VAQENAITDKQHAALTLRVNPIRAGSPSAIHDDAKRAPVQARRSWHRHSTNHTTAGHAAKPTAAPLIAMVMQKNRPRAVGSGDVVSAWLSSAVPAAPAAHDHGG
jgi:hypothetical protein